MRKGVGNWVAGIAIILLALAIIAVMVVIGTGSITAIAENLFN